MLLAQVGYGRGQKVHEGLDEGIIHGAILSPKDEGPDRLKECVADVRAQHSDAVVMIDPQFYVTTLRTPRDGRLPEYDFYANNAGLSRTHFGPRQVEGYIRDCLNYQATELPGLSYLISPNILFDDFRDLWSQIALSMAEAAGEFHAGLTGPPPLLVSIITSEVALRNAAGLAEFLDALSSLEVDGFYVLVHRNSSSYQAAMEPAAMANLMYMVYVLSRVNDYDVFVGYSDWLGALLHAAGATGTASGWHQSVRQFNTARFLPSEGGGRARKRYSSAPLLSMPLIQPELEDIFRARRIADVLTGSTYDAILSGRPSAGESRWTDAISCKAHWASLDQVISAVSTGRIASRLNAAIQLIDRADMIYTDLTGRGVQFEAQTGPGHLATWRDSITAFRAAAGI